MQETDIPAPMYLGLIDEYLGPSAMRFFGAGYRKVNHRVHEWGYEKTTGLTATVGVRYPPDWSRKKGVDLRPHLSTIDALVLAIRAAESCVTAAIGLDHDQRRTSWIPRVDIRAGTSPIEEGLDSIVVKARLATAPAVRRTPARDLSTVDCSVGAMRIAVEVEHDAVGRRGSPPDGLSLADLGQHDGPYGNGYREQWHTIRDVEIDNAGVRGRATVELAARDDSGVDGRATPSMVDSFAVSLQLGQVLLYELDGVARAGSDTLWMRTTTTTAAEPPRQVAGSMRTTVALADQRIFQLKGENWRTATIVGELLGLRTTCAVAHRLPGGA